jgi:hypothetical protein
MSAVTHPPQLWVGCHDDQPPDESRVNTIDYRQPDTPWVKPTGGFWTSTYDERTGSGWIQWCLAEQFGCERDETWSNLWRLQPAAGARIYTIDDYGDLAELVERFPHSSEYPWARVYPRWPEVAEHYDAVHLTASGEVRTRWDTPEMPLSLYGWDCESTLWLRWAFESVERIAPAAFDYVDELEEAEA